MLTRRQFHHCLMASLAVGLAPLPARATAPSRTALFLNRLSFGAGGQEADLNPMIWLEEQLALPARDPALDARLSAARLHISYPAGCDENGNDWPAKDELRPLAALFAPPENYLHCIDWQQGMDYAERARPAGEVIASALIRAVHAPAQLREVMTQFWHDHFNVNSQKDEFCAAFFPSYDAMLRANAFGNFRDMLGQVARAPAMLYYLNNADSRASPANENFARELLELHTLGAATRSHFDAEARMERGLIGANAAPGDPSGWLGRYLAAAAPQGPMPALAVGTSQPASLLGANAAVSESLGDLMVAAGHWLAPALRARLNAGFGDHGPLSAPIAGLLHLSEMIGQRLWSETDQALLNYSPAVDYPENPLTPALMTVAQTIKQDMGLRVATVDFASWDTHVNQSSQFGEMAGWLASSSLAFWRDLGALQQDVSLVVMSEFGRRLRSNSAGGTDHGRGNVMFVLGPQAKGGRMLGRWPGLQNEALEEGADLAVITDYRDVLAEILTGHMGLADASAVFTGHSAQPLGLWR